MKKQVSINHEWILRNYKMLTLLVFLLVLCHNSIASGESWDWVQVENKSVSCKVWIPSQSSASWTGNCDNGLINGYGILDVKGKFKYEGECRDGLKNGRGVMTWTDGEKYDGEWKNGQRNGRGVMIYSNGGKYDGDWRDGERNGRGVYTWSNGEKYDGEWKNNQRNGRGVQIDSIGAKYDVEWKDDKKHGRGVLIIDDGTKFEGEWKDDSCEAVENARMEKFVSERPRFKSDKKKQTSSSVSSSSSSSSSRQDEKANHLVLHVTFGSFWHSSVDRTVIKIKRIKNLAGGSVYYDMPYERKSEESSGIFNIPETTFWDPPYGYYKVEVLAYKKSSEESASFEVEIVVDRKEIRYELNVDKDRVWINR